MVIVLKKPIYLLPFIFVYKMVYLLFLILRYMGLGMFVTLYIFIDIIISTLYLFFKFIYLIFVYSSYYFYKCLKFIIKLILYLCYFVYSFVKHVFIGFSVPFVLLMNIINNSKKVKAKKLREKQQEKIIKEKNKQTIEENKSRLELAKKIEKEEKKKRPSKEKYTNESMVIEKKKFADYLNDLFNAIGSVPIKVKNRIRNNIFVKNARNKKDINREVLLLDLDGADAEKSEKKVMYKYVARNKEGKIIKGYFPAYSKVEVHSFLLSEGNEVYSIETNKWIKALYGDGASYSRGKIKTKDLIFFTAQLSTYLKAGITLVEALKILTRQFKNKNYSRIFRSMIYDLTMGDSFSIAMDKQGEAFPRLLINMVKASEMTGELPEALDDMCEYFTEVDKTRKQMITALTYPAIILVISLAAIVFIMVWVVPKFVNIYEGIGAGVPAITRFVINLSTYLKTNYLTIIITILVILLIFFYLYKNVKVFKAFIQWILMHLPVIGNVIIYNEVTMFTKTFSSLLAHNVFITDSMEILNKMTTNEIYKMLILDTINNLAKGEKISVAFKDHWAFPIPAYEMITTGEMTGQLPEMMSKVSSYYQELHKNSVTRIKTFVEPIMILILTVVVGVIVLSIVIPMFNIYTALNI